MKRSKTVEQETGSGESPRIRLDKRNILKIVIFIAIVLIGLNMKNILTYITGSESPIAVVKGYSMYPILREGDVVFSYKPKPEDIRVGDIIIYRSTTTDPRGGEKLIIHRVVNIKTIGGRYYYVTKGDNNPEPDGPGIPYDRVLGVVVSLNNATLKIPYIGYLSIWFHGG